MNFEIFASLSYFPSETLSSTFKACKEKASWEPAAWLQKCFWALHLRNLTWYVIHCHYDFHKSWLQCASTKNYHHGINNYSLVYNCWVCIKSGHYDIHKKFINEQLSSMPKTLSLWHWQKFTIVCTYRSMHEVHHVHKSSLKYAHIDHAWGQWHQQKVHYVCIMHEVKWMRRHKYHFKKKMNY
jgi:hypothetical protein